MYKRVLTTVLTLLLAVGLTSCGAKEPSASVDDTQTTTSDITKSDSLDQGLRYDLLNFSVELFKHQLEEDRNMVISPESMYFALGMTINGAKETTKQKLMDTLCSSVDLETFNSNVAYLLGSTDTNTCKIANSIWIRDTEDLTLKTDFKDYGQKYFNAEVYTNKFNDRFVKTVNKWVSKNTDGMIDGILDDVPPEDAMVYLMDAISFESTWMNEYQEYQVIDNDTFTNSQGEEQSVTMLYSNEDVYLSDSQASGFLKFYDGGQYAFMGILPNEGVSVDEYVESLTGEGFYSLLNSTESGDVVVSVSIPEYTCASSHILNDTLQDMGIVSAFDPANANFYDMVDTKNRNLYISEAIQKAYIQVDRNGTKAATISSLEMTDGCVESDDIKYFEVYLDRPFIYAIVDTVNGVPLFMGVVNDMAE